MKRKLYLVVGALLLLNIAYKMYRCLHCSDELFSFEVPGLTYILIHFVLAMILFYGASRESGKV